ncbi:hypothetical protein VO71_12530 [Aeromonas salmonicida subsp. smithia]|nr:hypothetical protein VO71_12530 [Aeromonas salmonicida subsp. smithia]
MLIDSARYRMSQTVEIFRHRPVAAEPLFPKVAVAVLAIGQFYEEPSPHPLLHKRQEARLQHRQMDRNEPLAVVCLELLIGSARLHADTPDVIHQHHIIGIELAGLVGSSPRVESQQGYPAAIGLLPFRPLGEPLPLLHRVTTSGLGLFDPLQLEPSEVVDDPLLMVSQLNNRDSFCRYLLMVAGLLPEFSNPSLNLTTSALP